MLWHQSKGSEGYRKGASDSSMTSATTTHSFESNFGRLSFRLSSATLSMPFPLLCASNIFDIRRLSIQAVLPEQMKGLKRDSKNRETVNATQMFWVGFHITESHNRKITLPKQAQPPVPVHCSICYLPQQQFPSLVKDRFSN